MTDAEPPSAVATLSVLVPAYNEAVTIGPMLDRLLTIGPILKEVIVVDDASGDATVDVIDGFTAEDARVRLVRLPINGGKTGAVATALRQATGDFVIVQDADLEYDPLEIPRVISPILADHADVVYGSRYLDRDTGRVGYFIHYFANRTLTFLCNLVTNRNLTDIETCYKAFRREVLAPLPFSSTNYGMEVEITALVSRTDARIVEVPVSYDSRSYAEGKKIGWRDGVAALYYILYYGLIEPRTDRGRTYVATVNKFLRDRRRTGRLGPNR